MVQIGGVYVASFQRSNVSFTAHIHILGAEIGLKERFGRAKKSMHLYQALHIQGGSYIESCVSCVCKVQHQYENHRW